MVQRIVWSVVLVMAGKGEKRVPVPGKRDSLGRQVYKDAGSGSSGAKATAAKKMMGGSAAPRTSSKLENVLGRDGSMLSNVEDSNLIRAAYQAENPVWAGNIARNPATPPDILDDMACGFRETNLQGDMDKYLACCNPSLPDQSCSEVCFSDNEQRMYQYAASVNQNAPKYSAEQFMKRDFGKPGHFDASHMPEMEKMGACNMFANARNVDPAVYRETTKAMVADYTGSDNATDHFIRQSALALGDNPDFPKAARKRLVDAGIMM